MDIFNIIIYISLAIIVALIIIFLVRFRKRIEIKAQLQIKSQIERHYEEVKNIYATMRGWRHDYHNHIQTLKGLMALDRHNELEKYLDELDEDLDNVDATIKSGNITVDAILNSKVSLALSRKIDVNVSAYADDKMTVSDIDLCIIIGNLIDNAIDACMDIEDTERRFIRIYIGKLKKQLYISVTNSTSEKVRNTTGIFPTQKVNKAMHGNGLKRVDMTTEKYGGFVNRQNEPEVFATEIMLPL
jgi:sensor histidine kinase regulating citrate/malate metabolism